MLWATRGFYYEKDNHLLKLYLVYTYTAAIVCFSPPTGAARAATTNYQCDTRRNEQKTKKANYLFLQLGPHDNVSRCSICTTTKHKLVVLVGRCYHVTAGFPTSYWELLGYHVTVRGPPVRAVSLYKAVSRYKAVQIACHDRGTAVIT